MTLFTNSHPYNVIKGGHTHTHTDCYLLNWQSRTYKAEGEMYTADPQIAPPVSVFLITGDQSQG